MSENPVRAEPAGASTTAPQPERPDVFITYSRRDAEFVRRLHSALVERGKDVWVDWEDIRKGAEWWAKIEGGIEATTALVPVLSPAFADSKVCADEVAHAVAHNKRVIPILRTDTVAELRDELKARNWIFFRDGDDFDAALDELVAAVETDLDWVDRHARLLVRAVEWESRGRDASLLLRGSDLKDAEDWLGHQGSHREQATPLQTEYVLASRKAASRRQRITLGAAAIALAVTAALAVLAWFQRNDALEQRRVAEMRERVARSRELAAVALSQVPVDNQRALLLALQANRVSPTAQSEGALRRALRSYARVRTLRGHVDVVRGAVFSLDGTRVLTGIGDGARVWHASTGRSVAALPHGGYVTSMDFSDDGKVITTAGEDGAVRVWDASSGDPLQVLTTSGSGPAYSADLSPDGKLVASAYLDGKVRIWNWTNRATAATLPGHNGYASDAAFSTDGRFVLTGAKDGVVRVWSSRLWTVVATMRTGRAVDQVDFSPDGRLIIATSGIQQGGNPAPHVYSARNGKSLAVLRGHDAPVTTAAFSRDSRLVATIGEDGSARVWEARTGRPLARLATRTAGAVSFGRSGLLATAHSDHMVRLWRARSGRRLAILAGHAGAVNTVAFDPSGHNLVSSSEDETARVWRVPFEMPALRGHRGSVEDAVFSGDGQRIATAGQDGTARVWDRGTRRAVATFVIPNASLKAVNSVEFHPRKPRLLTASDDDRARVWSVAPRLKKTLRTLQIGEIFANSADFSPDGNRIVVAGERNAVLFVDATAKKPRKLRGHTNSVRAAEFSRDGNLIVTASWDGTARIWNGFTGRIERVFRTRRGRTAGALDELVNDASFSPDGTLVATAGHDGTARVWQVRKGPRLLPEARLLTVLRGHNGVVYSASFSPSGRLLVTAGRDGTVRAWALATGLPVAVFRSPAVPYKASFGPDDTSIVAAESDGVARIYRCEFCGPVRQLIARARVWAIRPLTSEERETYLHESQRR